MSGFLGLIGQATILLQQWLGVAEGATGGALDAALVQLENVGLGEQVKSWLSHGENQTITADHVINAIPPAEMAEWSAKLGVKQDELAAAMAEMLPYVVNPSKQKGELGGKAEK